jgi:hypothetical protein
MKSIINLFIIFLVVNGCRQSSTEPSQPNETEWYSSLPVDSVVLTLLPVQGQISINFKENIKPNGRFVVLTLQSKKIYTSGGYTIVSNVSRTGLNIDVKIDSIMAPEGGDAIFAPAYSTFELDELPNSLYNLRILINGSTVQGLLSITDSAFNVRIQKNNLLYSGRPRLLRVPKYTIWGPS